MKHPIIMLVAALLALSAAPPNTAHAQSLRFDIETQADLDALLEAIRVSENVRHDFIRDYADLDNDGQLDDLDDDGVPDFRLANPRVVGVVAATIAFAERNPLAREAELLAFAMRIDDALAGTIPSDPNLRDGPNLYIALRFADGGTPETGARGDNGDALVGMDTDVNARALELLRYRVPELDGSSNYESRAAALRIVSRTKELHARGLADLLLIAFMEREPDGVTQRPELAQTLRSVLSAYGYRVDAVPGEIPTVDDAIAALPADIASFEALIADEGSSAAFRDEIASTLCEVSDFTDQALQALCVDLAFREELASASDDPDRMTPQLCDPLSLLGDAPCASSDPDDYRGTPFRDALEAPRDDLFQELFDNASAFQQQTFGPAASVYARTALLAQSDDPAVLDFATIQRDYMSLELSVASTTSTVQTGFNATVKTLEGLAGSVVIGPAALLPAIPAILDFANVLGAGGPSGEDQVFEQIRELRQQIEDVRVQMNQRFDRIDDQLNTFYDVLGTTLDDLGEDVDTLNVDLLGARTDLGAASLRLSRVEDLAFTLSREEYLNGLFLDTISAIDPIGPLPYFAPGGSYIEASSAFLSFATVTASRAAFVGDGGAIPFDSASETLNTRAASRDLRSLATLPPQLGLPAPWSPSQRFVSPSAWTQGATAYARLARQQPWSFAYQYRTQRDDPFRGSAPDIDRLIDDSSSFLSGVGGARSAELVDGLFDRYDAEIEALAAVATDLADLVIADEGLAIERDAPFTGVATIDPWDESPDLDPAFLAPASNSFFTGFFDNLLLEIPRLPATDARTGKEALYAFVTDDADRYRLALALRETLTGGKDETLFARVDTPPVMTEGVNFLNFVSFTIGLSADIDGAQLPVRLEREFVIAPRLVRPSNTSNFFDVFENDSFGLTEFIREVTGTPEGETFMQSILDGRVEGQVLVIPGPRTFNAITIGPGESIQLSFAGDFERIVTDDSDVPDAQAVVDAYLQSVLNPVQDRVWTTLLARIDDDTPNILKNTVDRLDDYEAVIDALVTVGFPDVMEDSVAARSAFRSAVDLSDTAGLRGQHVRARLLSYLGSGDRDLGVDAMGIDLGIRNEFIRRSEIARGEFLNALALFPDVPGEHYFGEDFAVTRLELDRVRSGGLELARPDAYPATLGESLIVDALSGVLANDTQQAGLDPGAFLVTPPSSGALSLAPDGSFMYVPDPGFVGDDTFTYTAGVNVLTGAGAGMDTFDGSVVSVPATVLIRVREADGPEPCLGDFDNDGDVDLGDFGVFGGAFNSTDADPNYFAPADFDNDGDVDLGDFGVFGMNFNCTTGGA